MKIKDRSMNCTKILLQLFINRHQWYLIISLVLIFMVDTRCFSQGVYYWSQNYGTRSNLLGGLVIGSVNDVSATYYNPGYLGLVEDPEIIIGAKIYELNNYKISFDEFEDENLS